MCAVAADGQRHVLAMGGLRGVDDIGRDGDGAPLLLAYAARLTGRPDPRICLLNTAQGDEPPATCADTSSSARYGAG